MNHAAATPPPLAGLTILDFTQWLAGPFATQILADLGARVIKVELPEGDGTRRIGPYFYRGDSAYFHSVNRSKESIVLDLKSAGGRAAALALAARCDVTIENFRPGVAKRLGADHATLRENNPRLIGCSITGFGQDGPYRDRPAYDMVAQAMAGVMSLTGEPGGRPVRCGIPIGDLAAGMFAAIGILAALVKRQRDGSGDYLDVAMLDSQISMLSYLGIYHLFAGIEPGPQGRGHYSIPTYRSFLAGDGREILITANSEKMWAGLCAALELPDLEHDPLYRTNAERLQNQASLISLLEARFAQRTSAEWLVRLAGHDVPAAPVNTVSEALADPQVAARDMVVSIHSPDGSTERLIGNPVKFASSESAAMRPAPRLGEQTQAVLHELLGYDEDRTRAVAGPH